MPDVKMKYKIAPSALTFLYDQCKRCYYLNVVHGISPPALVLPGIFTKIANLLKSHYDGKRTSDLHPDLPPGVVKYAEKQVKSRTIRFPDYNSSCFISGRFDIAIEFDDGSYGVIDFKTGKPHESKIDLYSRQLHAYSYALEHPAPGALSLSPVTKLGLLYFYPSEISQTSIERLSYEAEIQWIEIDKDGDGFMSFVEEVLGVLDKGELPESSPDCPWCDYISEFQNT
jgi:hypothetical protein